MTTTRPLRSFIMHTVIAVALQGTAAIAESGQPHFATARSVPRDIQAPAGHRAFLEANAIGTQNYICLPSGWTFLGPQATLFVNLKWFGTDVRQQIATHFLSANPHENSTPRPTWQSSFDTSSVWAKAVAVSTDPAFVAAGAIPWLLLEVTGAQRGPTGGTILSQTTYIQRVNTSGGITPTTVCSPGNIALVPYTADYIFFHKSGR